MLTGMAEQRCREHCIHSWDGFWLRMRGLISGACLWVQGLFQPPSSSSPALLMGLVLQTLPVFLMSDFSPGSKHSLCCIVASVFVVFPAQLEAGGT